MTRVWRAQFGSSGHPRTMGTNRITRSMAVQRTSCPSRPRRHSRRARLLAEANKGPLSAPETGKDVRTELCRFLAMVPTLHLRRSTRGSTARWLFTRLIRMGRKSHESSFQNIRGFRFQIHTCSRDRKYSSKLDEKRELDMKMHNLIGSIALDNRYRSVPWVALGTEKAAPARLDGGSRPSVSPMLSAPPSTPPMPMPTGQRSHSRRLKRRHRRSGSMSPPLRPQC